MAVDPKKLKVVKDLLDQIQKQYNKLGEKNPFDVDTTKIKDADKVIKKLEVGLESAEAKVRRIDTSFNELHKSLKAITAEFDKSQKPLNQMRKGMRGLVSEAQKLANEEDDIGSLSKKNLVALKDRFLSSQKLAKESAKEVLRGIDIGKLSVKSYKALTEEQKIAVGILKDSGKTQSDLLDGINKRIGLEDKFNKKLGFGGQLAGGLDKALQKAGIPSLGIASSIDEARKNFIATNGASSVFKDTIKGIGKNLKNALSSANLMQLGFSAMIKALISVDKESGEFAKNQGISYQRTLQIRGEMSRQALTSKDILVTSKAMMETQATLNNYFGQSVVFSGEMAEEFTSIAKRTKMSAESQGLFALESMKTGKTGKTLLKNQITQTMELNRQFGLQMSAKQIQEAIGKTSKSLQLTYRGSTEELTKQVMAAKALGANMETVSAIASSLLDFESSIQAELEAELLLGKNINLEKARQFALQGDMAGVADEVMKNQAIMLAFETKNVIAQEAAAKALGMGREDLAAMIHEQEKLEEIRKFGAEDMVGAQTKYNDLRKGGMSAEQAALEVGDKALADQLATASAAERFESILLRIQEVFVAFSEPILAIVDGIMLMTGGAENFANILVGIAATYLIIKGAMMASKALQAGQLAYEGAKAAIMGTQAVAATTTNAMATFGIGTVIAIAAVTAGLASLATYGLMSDGVIGPGGEMVVSGPKGSIQLDKDDSIIAGTNLGGKGKSSNNNINIQPIVAAINAQNIILNQIASKSTVIEMGGNEVGQGINTAERQIQ